MTKQTCFVINALVVHNIIKLTPHSKKFNILRQKTINYDYWNFKLYSNWNRFYLTIKTGLLTRFATLCVTWPRTCLTSRFERLLLMTTTP